MVKSVHQLMIINIFLSTSECLAKNGWNKLTKKPGKCICTSIQIIICVNCDPILILKGCFGERGDPYVSCFKSSQLFIFFLFYDEFEQSKNLPLDNEGKGVKNIYYIVGYTV